MCPKRAAGFALALILLVLASMPAINQAATKIVGGSDNWRFGFNYSDWAHKNGPFYQNDTLVFKYDPPNSTTFPHSVYLLENNTSYQACELKNATLVANQTQGGGTGFEFVLCEIKDYYFACGERNGTHCSTGLMKFVVRPLEPCLS
ncbi:uncharacterized protein LOC131244358 [Magnolia sinica]|uniref:uncharacterized protein LOC131244358 n=1 Tax=Magnolia sinica TaxID=86752 RepID=UPI00265990DC|nr:uncharacterized protein LOC131244358 [Magnolia sinica]